MEGKEIIMSIEKRLHEASFSGNVDHLHHLMAEDRLSLARSSTISFNETPLHVAAMLGHLDFTRALIGYRSELAAEVDCRGSTPLHLASANGYVGIVKVLLQVNSDACFVRDEEGRTPLCLAVMKGRIEVAEELIRVKPEAAKYSLNATGETLLHLAVKYNRFDCLKMLVERARESQDVLNTRDDNGNTVLHLAVCLKQTETVKYLLGAGITMDAVNANGLTALDTVAESNIIAPVPCNYACHEHGRNVYLPKREGDWVDKKFASLTIAATVVASMAYQAVLSPPGGIWRIPRSAGGRNVKLPKREEDWVEKKFASLTIAATVVASMAYQAVLSPPGGLWSSDSGKDNQRQFEAGTSILATRNADFAEAFWICNTISFISSSSILFLLVSGIPLRRKFMVWVLMFSMSITITSIAVAYSVAMGTIQPETEILSSMLAVMAIYAWLILLGIVFLVQTVRFFIMACKKLRKCCLSRRTSTRTSTVSV